MRNPFRAKPKPFLDAPRRDWQFEAFAWLLRNCGGHSRFLDTTLVLPVEEHFPDRGMKGHAAVAALFRRVRDHAGMADWPCMVEPLTGEPRSTAGTDRIRVIHYDPASWQPVLLVASFAHELASYLVESFDEPPPGGDALRDHAIDLATVFIGFGVFMANSAAECVTWNLNESELVHALALFCLLRKADTDAVEQHLNPHIRKYLRLAALDLGQYAARFQALRATVATASATGRAAEPAPPHSRGGS